MDKRFRILAVDDEPINIQLIKSALKEEYDFLTAVDGHDAIDQLEKYMPDLILLDVLMPDMDGFEVCNIIKRDEKFADIPVIFMTALDTDEGAVQGLELGAVDYLTKPVNMQLLKLRVRNHIALKVQRDQLLQQKEELAKLLAERDALYERERAAEDEKLLLQEKLLENRQLESLGVLAGGIAHDFNNILTIIIGNCYLIKQSPESAAQHISIIEKSAERAAVLCRQMLEYAGQTILEITQVDMVELLEDVVKTLKATIPPNAMITLDLPPDIPIIKGDARQIRQIAMNMVINASEAIGENQGTIHIALTQTMIKGGKPERDHLGKIIPPGSYICLEVVDSGCGMDDETKRRIFEPFYTSKFTGRGLGMPATLGIITAHGGALQLVSQLGQGATFRIYLPIETAEEIVSPLPEESPAYWQGSGTILLVEDEEMVMNIASSMLQMLGFTTLEAVNGEEALELYRQNSANISLVLTDIGMPVMDGCKLFSELKKLDPNLPIIISSGYGDAMITSHIPREAIAGLISKPYNIGQLSNVLKSVVGG